MFIQFLFLIIWAGIFHLLAYRRGYLHLEESKNSQVCLWQVLVAFALIFILLPVLTAATTLLPFKINLTLMYRIIYIGVFVLFIAYPFWLDRRIAQEFFAFNKGVKSVFKDTVIGIGTWFLAAPVVSLVMMALDGLVRWLTHQGLKYEQDPVTYLKNLQATDTGLFIFVLIFVSVIDPFIEELFFRGFIQSWIKRHLGVKWTILITSMIFSAAHASISQHWGNIVFLGTIFTLSLYLGFLKEKRGTIFAPWGLHMTFNTINTFFIALRG